MGNFAVRGLQSQVAMVSNFSLAFDLLAENVVFRQVEVLHFSVLKT